MLGKAFFPKAIECTEHSITKLQYM